MWLLEERDYLHFDLLYLFDLNSASKTWKTIKFMRLQILTGQRQFPSRSNTQILPVELESPRFKIQDFKPLIQVPVAQIGSLCKSQYASKSFNQFRATLWDLSVAALSQKQRLNIYMYDLTKEIEVVYIMQGSLPNLSPRSPQSSRWRSSWQQADQK